MGDKTPKKSLIKDFEEEEDSDEEEGSSEETTVETAALISPNIMKPIVDLFERSGKALLESTSKKSKRRSKTDDDPKPGTSHDDDTTKKKTPKGLMKRSLSDFLKKKKKESPRYKSLRSGKTTEREATGHISHDKDEEEPQPSTSQGHITRSSTRITRSLARLAQVPAPSKPSTSTSRAQGPEQRAAETKKQTVSKETLDPLSVIQQSPLPYIPLPEVKRSKTTEELTQLTEGRGKSKAKTKSDYKVKGSHLMKKFFDRVSSNIKSHTTSESSTKFEKLSHQATSSPEPESQSPEKAKPGPGGTGRAEEERRMDEAREIASPEPSTSASSRADLGSYQSPYAARVATGAERSRQLPTSPASLVRAAEESKIPRSYSAYESLYHAERKDSDSDTDSDSDDKS